MDADALLAACQRIVDGPFRHAADGRAAAVAREWPAFARRIAPARPLVLRGDWSACVEFAAGLYRGPAHVIATIVPVWACSAAEVESLEWVKVHAIVVDDAPYIAETGPYFFQQDGPVISELVEFEARRYEVGYVVRSESYAPSIELALRRGAFGVVATNMIVLDRIRAASDRAPSAGSPLPPPDLEVRPFSTRFEVRVAGVPQAIATAIAGLSFSASADEWDEATDSGR